MTSTLLISTYNWPEALRLTLLSAFRQRELPTRIVICDDGSRSDTKALIDAMRPLSPVSLEHLWQEDKGFRLARVRNMGIAYTPDDYIIQIDGDLILHPCFVADHLAAARCGAMLRGRRVPLNEDITKRLCAAGVLPRLGFMSSGIEKRRLNTLRLPALARLLAPRYRKNRPGIMGCNMSYWREDVEAVNGYDETFEGWGSEDSDLCIRMQLNGVNKLDLKFAAVAYHLWHGHSAMDNKQKNEDYSRRVHSPGDVLAPRGLNLHTRQK